MRVVKDNRFGGNKPLNKVFHSDLVEINENIREEHSTYEGEECISYFADTTLYTYNEYVKVLDDIVSRLSKED